jgi:hypothetical protein
MEYIPSSGSAPAATVKSLHGTPWFRMVLTAQEMPDNTMPQWKTSASNQQYLWVG